MYTKTYTYEPLFELSDGGSKEIHFALRSDGKYIISRCQVLRDGTKLFMRSSVVLEAQLAIDLAKNILGALDTK